MSSLMICSFSQLFVSWEEFFSTLKKNYFYHYCCCDSYKTWSTVAPYSTTTLTIEVWQLRILRGPRVKYLWGLPHAVGKTLLTSYTCPLVLGEQIANITKPFMLIPPATTMAVKKNLQYVQWWETAAATSSFFTWYHFTVPRCSKSWCCMKSELTAWALA